MGRRTLKIPPGISTATGREVFGRFSGLTELQISASHTLTTYGLRELASVGLTSLYLCDSCEDCCLFQLDDGLKALALGGFPVL